MPDEYEIQAVMLQADCGREKAVEALMRTDCRVGFAIRLAVSAALGRPECPFCGAELNMEWKYCAYCGAKLPEEREE